MKPEPQAGSDAAAQIAEGIFLHQRLFGFAPSPEILSRYAAFLSTIDASAGQHQIERIVDGNLDVEAIVYALRFRHRHHPLQQRIHGLCFVCEANPRYWTLFYSERTMRASAWAELAFTAVRSGWLLVKGTYLIQRHSIV